MNQKDRKRLAGLRQLINSIPFPHAGGGTRSQSIVGCVAYQNDMRNLLPVVSAVLAGMVREGMSEMEEGYDYQNPDKLMDVLGAWIEKRKAESWCNVPDYDFNVFWEQNKKE